MLTFNPVLARRLSTKVFHKVQNMRCVAVERMQVVTHYYDHYARKSEFLYHFPGNAFRLKICTKTDKLTLHRLARGFNSH